MSKIKLDDVSSRYGAPMGRRDEGSAYEYNMPIKFRLQRLKWVDYDYDEGGAYWGCGGRGQYIYVAEGECDIVAEGECDIGDGWKHRLYVRAIGRREAKKDVLERYPNARFYR